MLLAIIPARGGSKGIPRKNLALLNGRPLIEYTLRAALDSKFIDDILLSTDDDEIASFALTLGLDTAYRRPAELALDTTPMIDTLTHGIQWYQKASKNMPQTTMLLQPTSPLRNAADIDHAISTYYEKSTSSLVSVHELNEHPYECIHGEGKDACYLVNPPVGVSRRQDYDNSYYYINGAIYISDTEKLLTRRSFIEIGDTYFLPMPRARGIDIDTPYDLKLSEVLLNAHF